MDPHRRAKKVVGPPGLGGSPVTTTPPTKIPFPDDRKLRETTLAEGIKVIEARAAGLSFREIKAKLPVSNLKPSRSLPSEREGNDKIHDALCSGCPEILSVPDKRDLYRLAMKDLEVCFTQIRRLYEEDGSASQLITRHAYSKPKTSWCPYHIG